ncbi:glycosyl hydrolase family 18 protein [Thiotrichales bacterium 19S11-10]|nr:glycosyl hydrolase family 18 protein [Thiotrichales bacterium 19S11-10]
MYRLWLVFYSCFLFSITYGFDEFPDVQAGSYYPIYNSGKNQYIEPTDDMPFDKISTLYLAFAHAYPYPDTNSNSAVLTVEHDQPDEPDRIKQVVELARKINPKIKIIISLGWSYSSADWIYINKDYESGYNLFPKSIVYFIMKYNLDGFDIDDEFVSKNVISQANFDQVVKNIRRELDLASKFLKRRLFFTITPAFGTASVTENNQIYFDMINTQNYGSSYPSQFMLIGVPPERLSSGVNSEGCWHSMPSSKGMAGVFNWTFSADSNCNWQYTNEIASQVGYHIETKE